MPPTHKNAFQKLRENLCQIYDHSEATTISELALEAISGMSKSQLIIHPDKKFTEIQWQQWQQIEKELLANRPVQYVLGKTKFYGLTLNVNESVLIPRPETEQLVDWIIYEIKSLGFSEAAKNILDIGTGSGCIALSLKKYLPETFVFAADYSESVLKTATENAQQNNLEITFLKWNVLDSNIPKSLPHQDFIISNPPYVTFPEKSTLAKNVLDYEPHEALFVTDNDPLQFYKKIEEIALSVLKPNGELFLELNEEFAEKTEMYFSKRKWKTTLKKDFQGKSRMLRAKKYLNT